jgi:hypothetical protein
MNQLRRIYNRFRIIRAIYGGFWNYIWWRRRRFVSRLRSRLGRWYLRLWYWLWDRFW